MTAVAQRLRGRRLSAPLWLRSYAPWIGGARPVWFVALPAVVLLTFLQASALSATMSLYWADGSRLVAAAVGMTVPVVSCAAAWQTGRLRASGVFGVAAARSWLAIMGGALAPVVGVGLVGQGVAWLCVARLLRDVPGAPDPRWVATSCAWTLAAAAMGGAIGRWFPLMISLPVSLLVPYVGSAAPMGMVSPWPRHLTPFVAVRLSVADLPDPRLIVAQLASATAVLALGAAVLAVGGPRMAHRMSRVGCALACAVVAGAGAWFAVTNARGLDYHAWVPRPADDTVCRAGPGVAICLYPEQQAVRADVAAAVQRTTFVAHELGFTHPTMVTAALVAPADAWSGILLDTRNGHAARDAVLVAAAAQMVGSCQGATSASLEAAGVLSDILLVSVTGDSGREPAASNLPPGALDLAVTDPAALRGWAQELSWAARSCTATAVPTLQPGM